MVKEAADTPPNRTAVALLKLVPLMVMTPPIGAVDGLNEDSMGLVMYTIPVRVAVPPGVVI